MITISVQSLTGESDLLPLIGGLRSYEFMGRGAKIAATPKEDKADLVFTLSGVGRSASLPYVSLQPKVAKENAQDANSQANTTGTEAQGENSQFKATGAETNTTAPKVEKGKEQPEKKMPKMSFHVTGGHHYSRTSMSNNFVLNGFITELDGTKMQQEAQIEYDARKHTGTTTIPRSRLCAYTQQRLFYETQKREQQAALAQAQQNPKGGAKPHNRRKV